MQVAENVECTERQAAMVQTTYITIEIKVFHMLRRLQLSQKYVPLVLEDGAGQ